MLAENKMAAKFIENGILGTSRKCSKDEEKGGTSAGSSHPDEVEYRPDRMAVVRHSGGMSMEKNSGCDISGWNELCHTSQGESSAWPRERGPRGTF